MSISQNGKTRTERNIKDYNAHKLSSEDDIKKIGEFNNQSGVQNRQGGENTSRGRYLGINGGESTTNGGEMYGKNGRKNSDVSESNSETLDESEDENSEFPTIKLVNKNIFFLFDFRRPLVFGFSLNK